MIWKENQTVKKEALALILEYEYTRLKMIDFESKHQA